MGICPINKTFRVVPTNSDADPLTKCRSDFIEKLRKLHHLHLKCKKFIESLIFEQNQELALKIKAKQLEIKELSQVLQVSIEKLDNSSETIKTSSLRARFSEEIIKIVNEKEKALMIDQLDLVLNSKNIDLNSELLESTSAGEGQVKKNEVHSKLKLEAEKLDKLNKGSDHQRRSYVKSFS
jgi:predicted transcriptional regulator